MLRFPNFDARSISIRFLAQNDDFDSIRFDSSCAHAKSFPTKFRDNRRQAVVFEATYCLYKTRRRILIDVNSRYVSADNSLPVTSDQLIPHASRICRYVKLTGDNHGRMRTTHQQHSQKLDAWH